MKESLSKSISEIMAFFNFNLVADIESEFFCESANECENLTDVIKEFSLKELYECVKKFSDKEYDCWTEGKYHLRFEYIYDKENPYMQLKYIPESYEVNY